MQVTRNNLSLFFSVWNYLYFALTFEGHFHWIYICSWMFFCVLVSVFYSTFLKKVIPLFSSQYCFFVLILCRVYWSSSVCELKFWSGLVSSWLFLPIFILPHSLFLCFSLLLPTFWVSEYFFPSSPAPSFLPVWRYLCPTALSLVWEAVVISFETQNA